MTKRIAIATETQLAMRTGIDRQKIPALLTAAGIVPVSEEAGKAGRIFRRWPSAAATKALQESDVYIGRAVRDDTAATQAKILDIKRELADGTRIRMEDFTAEMDRIMGIFARVLRAIPGRHAAEVARINSSRYTAEERAAAMNRLYTPMFSSMLIEIRSPAPWQK